MLVLEKNSDLPKGWALSYLGLITKNHDGKRIPVNASLREKMNGKYPYYGASGIIDHVNKPIFKGDFLLIGEDGANLLARSTPIAFIAKGEFWVNNHAHVLTTLEGIQLEFLSHFINSINLSSWVTGTAQPKLNQANMNKIPILIPPLNEQKRIVAKIEEIFSLLDFTKHLIEKIDPLLKQYKQSLLKSAFEGKLTEKWRNTNPKIKSIHVLLKEIVENRNKLYTVQLENAKSKGLRKNKSKFLLEIPKIILKDNRLPSSWTVVNVNFLAFVTKLAGFEYTKYIKPQNDGDVPLIRAQNVQMGKFDNSNIKFISKDISDNLERSQINGTEILMVFVGAGTGNVCMSPNGRRWHLAPNVAKIDVNGIPTEYLYYYLQSPIGILDNLSRVKASAQQSLSMENIRKINVTLPPLEEQQEIITMIEEGISLIQNIETLTNSLSSQLITLRSVILKQAFEGKLVPQDPNDEPASELLKRIKLQN